MGMGYGANHILAVNEEKLRKEFQQEFKALEATLKSVELSMEDLAQAEQYQSSLQDEYEDISDAQEALIYDTLGRLTKAFKDTYGMKLYLGYHDSSGEGDRYDDVDGVFFSINHSEVYDIKPEAKVLNEKIGFEDQFFVTYG